jgi:hypothetical protein
MSLILPYRAISVKESMAEHWYDLKSNAQYVVIAESLEPTEFLGICLENQLKTVFGNPQILNPLESLFWGHISKSYKEM